MVQTNLKQSENVVIVEGYLKDYEIIEGVTKTDNREYVRGHVTLEVSQVINGIEGIHDINIPFFATKFTRTGKTNPSYDSIIKLRDCYTRAADGDSADRIRATGGALTENFFKNNNGQMVYTWRPSASFFSRVTNNFTPSSQFVVFTYIKNIEDEEDSEGNLTGRLKLTGIVVRYNGTIDEIPFIVEKKDAINYINAKYRVGDTVRLNGVIRSTVVESSSAAPANEDDMAFGDAPSPTSYSRVLRELIVTGGSAVCADPDLAYAERDIIEGMKERKMRIDEEMNKAVAAKTNTGSANKASSWS